MVKIFSKSLSTSKCDAEEDDDACSMKYQEFSCTIYRQQASPIACERRLK